MASPEGRNDEREKGRDGENVVYSPILRFADSGAQGLGAPIRSRKFFQFFETTIGLVPYLAYEKSNPHPHNNTLGAWPLCTLPGSESICSRSSTGRRLSRGQYGRGPKRTS